MFVITLPRSYHCGFGGGGNLGEAVNFATASWLPFGAQSVKKFRRMRKSPIFSHTQLVCDIAPGALGKPFSGLRASVIGSSE